MSRPAVLTGRPGPLGRLGRLGGALAVAAALTLGAAAPASAHSLDSSTISLVVDADGAGATVSVAEATLAQAYAEQTGSTLDLDTAAGRQALTTWLDEHTSLTVDGEEAAESWSTPTAETIEGIASVSAEVAFDTGSTAGADLALTYDAVLDSSAGSDSGHEAVVVLTDADGDISTAGTLSADADTLVVESDGSVTVTGSSAGTGARAMIGLGFHHVLEGADHLLFLLTLLLPAPLMAAAGRWRRPSRAQSDRSGPVGVARRVAEVVTAFTVGHSLTLIAASLGWVALPTTLVEVLVAGSVAVAGVHAWRPLVRGGEIAIAGVFGLVHGLAFAGILADLGLQGTTSVTSLLAFNVGVELAGLAVVASMLPALYALSRTRWYPAVRTSLAAIAVLAASGWVVDRLGLMSNPLAGAESAAIAHLLWWPILLSLLAVLGCALALEQALEEPTTRSVTPREKVLT